MAVTVWGSRGMKGIHLPLVWILAALSGIFVGCGDHAYCPEGQSWCWAKCIDLMTDEDNCGQCENQCDPHSDCVTGACTCVADYTSCSNQCVNLNFDVMNCGTCGNSCRPDELCVNGQCHGSCAHDPFINCGDDDCVDPTTNEEHCGACNNACRADQVCSDGVCTCFRTMQECDGECVDTQYDRDHCGQCYNKCTVFERCANGSCVVDGCPAGEWPCGRECFNLQTSNDHCGQCDNACDVANGFVCRDGECECFFGEECVAGVCSNLSNDEANCGSCGNACRADQVCNEGDCECVVGMTECGDPPVCVDTQRDPNNCGVCDNQCPTGGYCVAGICGNGCPPPWVLCGSDCVDLQTSNSHCGQCDNPCDIANGFICQSGICDCAGVLDDCDGVCVDLDRDEYNCGACGVTCGILEYCMDGYCREEIAFDHIEVTCPESALPTGMSMQCSATAIFIGGLTLDVTNDSEWYQEIPGDTDCTNPGDPDCGVIYSLDQGLVTATEDTGLVGDREYIWASYFFSESNQWSIGLIQDYMCDVKIVPEQNSFDEFDKNDDLTLPYLADASDALEWRMHAVAILRGNQQCNQGGPFFRELAADAVDWQLTPSAGIASFDPLTGIFKEVHQASYPAGNLGVTVSFEYQDGTDVFTDDLPVTIIPLTDTNWSLTTEPVDLIIPAGMTDGFRAFLDFENNRVDVTHIFDSGSSWMARSLTELPAEDLVTEDAPGYVTDPGDPLEGMWGITAGSTEGSTTVRLTMDDAQIPPHTEQNDVPVYVDSAVPRYCKIFESNGTTPATPGIYPEGHPAVQYRVMACMSTTACDPDVGPFDTEITDQDWGHGWVIDYPGGAGLLGFVDAYGSASPGLYHIPSAAPQNPNPDRGTIQYIFGPRFVDNCEVEVRVHERYLCQIDLTAEEKVEAQEPQMTRRLWWEKADGTAEVLMPNLDGLTQKFFVYGTFGILDASSCALNNQYTEALPYGDIDEWEYIHTDGHADEIFGTIGVDQINGIGTVSASATEPDRVAEIVAHVRTTLHVCEIVAGCTDSIVVNACGVLPAVPDRRLVSAFSEIDGFEEQTVQISVGDASTKVYGISKYDSPAGGCYAVAGQDTEYYLDESHQTNVEFYSQSSTIASVDHDGVISANSPGQTLLEVDWDGGPVEDNLTIEVLPAQ